LSVKPRIIGQSEAQMNVSESINEISMCSQQLGKLTNKKKQYLQDLIADKNGVFSYIDNPEEYKKARKRLQNRESAVRSRMRKRNYMDELEQQLQEQQDERERLEEENERLRRENQELKAENKELRGKVSHYSDVFAEQAIAGSNDYVHRDQLEQFKISLLAKLNQQFADAEPTLSTPEQTNEGSHVIQAPPSREQDYEMSQLGDPLETVASIDYAKKKSRKGSGTFCKESSATSTDEDLTPENVLVLRREQTSNSGRGYFFLAVMFGMLCSSSLVNNPSQSINTEEVPSSGILN
jgi:cell division protein FtsB